MRSTSPVNSTWVRRLSISEVPSKICEGSRLNDDYLDNSLFAVDLKDLTLADGAVSEAHLHNLGVSICGQCI
jgi:hypothetical protein